MADRFEDHRGVIRDLLGPVDAVTQIFTKAGAVRGNHVHKLTTQWTYIVHGRLLIAAVSLEGDGIRTWEFGQHHLIEEPAGIPHAWKALEDTCVLVFTKGPRSGEAYESDTTRLEVPILT